jgi:hypothetical protein
MDGLINRLEAGIAWCERTSRNSLWARDPAENRCPAGDLGIATDGAKAFAVGKPVADRHGDLGAITDGRPRLGLVIGHAG